MWLFTDLGFFSIVQHNTAPTTLIVRGRSQSDVIGLVERYGKMLGIGYEDIMITPDADYCCRVIVQQDRWASVVFDMVKNIDYDNFKNTIYEKMGFERAHLYGDVWQVMYRLQKHDLKSEN